ncbi:MULTISPECIES: site-specific integrase [Pseudomonas]|uniref:tyrosine-type recombinase/integrase n=1 Tax=Pseudomonas TaxID=286 RepID=UPI000D004ECE|nr:MULTISPECIES: site-specific integrase [Pseudomonas]PRA54703.1 integrase [Pseudomonas sp. MYb115]QXN49713.1 site-specific integrase [Pseudomonas fluorescens]WSO24027.1 site-specific integrase [Pseudomonas fluorescens]
MSLLAIRHVQFRQGERHKLLVNAQTGIPLYYPSLFITTQIRACGFSVSTVQASLTALKVLYAWQAVRGINLEASFSAGNLFRLEDITSLVGFSARLLSEERPRTTVKVVRLRLNAGRAVTRSVNNVSAQTQFSRLSTISKYLGFLAETLRVGRTSLLADGAVSEMVERINAYRPKSSQLTAVDRDEKGLDQKVVDEVLERLRFGHPKNPFADNGVQQRNHLIVTLLRYLGIRRGELLSLRVEDVDFGRSTLSIVRRPDSPLDSRRHQPLVKTKPRKIPINDVLQKALSDYIFRFRASFRLARKHPYLLVTHKAGPTQGSPMSNSSFGKLMATVQGMAHDFAAIHAHAFRHTWNYDFSCVTDAAGNMTPEQEQKARAYLMGWSETSGTAITYNKRHTKEKAAKAALEFQRALKRQ